MDWQNVLWIAGFAVLFWFMMRGCGGMRGGFGMGGRRNRDAADATSRPNDSRRDTHRAA
jgi:hypothetical protein